MKNIESKDDGNNYNAIHKISQLNYQIRSSGSAKYHLAILDSIENQAKKLIGDISLHSELHISQKILFVAESS